MGFANARTPRERQRAQTVTEILDAALAQMERDGVAALNLTEVAARVGLAQPSLYRYFPSRAAVYDALFARGMTMHRDLLRATADSAPPGWAAVQAMMRVTVGFAADNPTLAQLLFVPVGPDVGVAGSACADPHSDSSPEMACEVGRRLDWGVVPVSCRSESCSNNSAAAYAASRTPNRPSRG